MFVKIRTTFKDMAKVLTSPDTNKLDTEGNTNLLFTGAKAYYLDGGWWKVYGYAMDNSDVLDVVTKINLKHIRPAGVRTNPDGSGSFTGTLIGMGF